MTTCKFGIKSKRRNAASYNAVQRSKCASCGVDHWGKPDLKVSITADDFVGMELASLVCKTHTLLEHDSMALMQWMG